MTNLATPLHPGHVAAVSLNDRRASALQFRYLWVTDADGLKVLDVTRTDEPRLIPEATVAPANAQGLYVARTYASVAGGPIGRASRSERGCQYVWSAVYA